MEMKNVFLDLKTANETGVFRGVLSTYGYPADLGGDVIQRGAFTKTLAETRGRLPLLLAHDGSKQLGFVKLTDSEAGLQAEGVLNMESPLAREIHSNLIFNQKHQIPAGLSIGYIPVKATPQKDGTRLLNEVRLKEASYTLSPMNEQALITAAKQRGTGSSELAAMVESFSKKLDAIVGRPLLSHQHQTMVDSFARKLATAVRS
jgi:uncharacterized protein